MEKGPEGAYTFLSSRPGDVGLFAMFLTDKIAYFLLVGIFGWAGTPAVFVTIDDPFVVILSLEHVSTIWSLTILNLQVSIFLGFNTLNGNGLLIVINFGIKFPSRMNMM